MRQSRRVLGAVALVLASAACGDGSENESGGSAQSEASPGTDSEEAQLEDLVVRQSLEVSTTESELVVAGAACGTWTTAETIGWRVVVRTWPSAPETNAPVAQVGETYELVNFTDEGFLGSFDVAVDVDDDGTWQTVIDDAESRSGLQLFAQCFPRSGAALGGFAYHAEAVDS